MTAAGGASDLWRRDPHSFRGRVETRPIESALLCGNPAGDAHVREVPVYVPPGAAGERFPAVFVLSGFTGRGQAHLETHPWRLGLVARWDRAVAAGEAPPAVLVLPDGLTRLGGGQYVNSSHNGPWADHVARELPAWVDAHYPTEPGRRAIVGKSSGGFGALHLGMRHPDVFPVVASISGDCGFELSLAPELPRFLTGLVPHGGDPARFLAEHERAPVLDDAAHSVLLVLAMAAAYSPSPESPLGFDLPVDLTTGERVEAVWKRWLAFDPLHDAPRHADALRRLRLLHLECGLRDEYHLQWGLRQLVAALRSLDVPHRHEEHDGTHRGLDDRYLALLPRLVEALG